MTESPRSCRTATLILAGVLLLYVPVFFASWSMRWESLWLLLLPDQILLSWLGGRPGDFGLVDRLPLLAIVLAILLAADTVGRWSLESVFRVPGLTPLESAVFGLAVGLSLWSLLALAIGLAGWLHAGWLLRGLIAAALAGRAFRLFRRRPPGQQTQQRPDPGWLPRWTAWLAVPFVLLILAGGMLPPWEFDVREYHLQVPKEWYQAGRIEFLPHNVYGNMPMGAEMHALLAMVLIPGEDAWWWGALAGKTVIACFAPLTALAVYAAGRRLSGRTAGIVAALVYISLPWVAHVSVTGLVEGVSGFYIFLALQAVLIWQQRAGTADSAAAWGQHYGGLLLAGFLAGSAAGCKYTGLLFAVAPILLLVLSDPRGNLRIRGVRHLFLREPQATDRGEGAPTACSPAEPRSGGGASRIAAAGGGRLAAGGLFLAAALCACGLWYAKNAWQTGNPIYPLVFGARDWTAEQQERWDRAHQVPRDAEGRRYSLQQAAAAVADFGWRDRGQSLLVVPLALMAAWFRSHRRWILCLALYAAFYLAAWWLFTHRIHRFYVPLFPVLSLLAGVGAAACASAAWRRLVGLTLGLGLCVNLLLIVTADHQDHRYLVALGVLREDPVREERVSRIHPAHRYLNQHAERVRAVLLVGDAEPFDLEVPTRYSTCFDENLFQRLLEGRTAEQRRAALQAAGISHVYVDWSEIDRYRRPGNYGFTDYVTRSLVRDELVARQGLLRPVPLPLDRESGELFEVVGSPAGEAPKSHDFGYGGGFSGSGTRQSFGGIESCRKPGRLPLRAALR